MTKNKLWQAIKGLTLAAGMAVGIFALGQTDVLADTLTLTVEKNTIGQGMILDPVQVEVSERTFWIHAGGFRLPLSQLAIPLK